MNLNCLFDRRSGLYERIRAAAELIGDYLDRNGIN